MTGLKPCGKCDTCKFHPEIMELCNGGEIFGLLPGPKHYLNGWFGEYMKVNKGGVVFNVSDMDRDLRILIEPAAVIVHAVEQAKQIFNFQFNSYVLVQGCGPIGLLLLAMVRCLGVRNIIACDGDDKRLAFAKKLGAKYTVNGLKPGAIEKVMALTEGKGAEMVFQCTGSPKAASVAWKYIRRGGSFCELGFFTNNGDTTYSPHLDMCNKQVKACGSWTYQAKDWVQAFDFLKEAKERKLPITKLITHKYPLDKMNEAMEMNISMKGLKIAYIASTSRWGGRPNRSARTCSSSSRATRAAARRSRSIPRTWRTSSPTPHRRASGRFWLMPPTPSTPPVPIRACGSSPRQRWPTT